MNIQDYWKEYENGNLALQRKDGLVLFDYNRTCQYSRNWNETTLSARGIVFEEATGKLVARPLKKFFNYQELEFQNLLATIPKNIRFTSMSKEDGSCGICYFYNGTWHINTRGSFMSDQAVWGEIWLHTNVDLNALDKDFTYVFEIVYRKNKIVIDYGEFEGLILLAAIHTEIGYELDYSQLQTISTNLSIRLAEEQHFSSLEEILEVAKVLDANHEGFVVKFAVGNEIHRCKIKGDKYCAIHKMISNMTPLSFWEAVYLDTLKIPVSFLAELPEEFRETSDQLKEAIEGILQKDLESLNEMVSKCPESFESEKDRWFYLVDNFGANNASLVLTVLKGNRNKAHARIHKNNRPTGNVIPGVDLSRVNRILDNNG